MLVVAAVASKMSVRRFAWSMVVVAADAPLSSVCASCWFAWSVVVAMVVWTRWFRTARTAWLAGYSTIGPLHQPLEPPPSAEALPNSQMCVGHPVAP